MAEVSLFVCLFSPFEALLEALLDLDNFHEFSRLLNDGFKNFHSKINTSIIIQEVLDNVQMLSGISE